MAIGERIRQARKRAGLTQKQLGEVSGTSETTVKQYELGKRQPRIEQLQAIAAALEVPVWELMDRENSVKFQKELVKNLQARPAAYQPWTQIDQKIFDMGGFEALAEFEFLSEEDKIEALTDIKKFVDFTLSKYRQQQPPQPAPEMRPDSPPAPPEGEDTTAPEKPTEEPPEGE